MFQGGLEIPIKLFVSWSNEKSMTILIERVKRVNSPYEMDYVDDWKKNLKRFALREHGGKQRRSGSMRDIRM